MPTVWAHPSLHSRSNMLLFGEYHAMLPLQSELQQRTRIAVDAGFRLDARIFDADHRFGFGELSVSARVYVWQLSAGRFKDTIGLGSEGLLTTGSMLMSRNALQPFKLRLSTPEFLPVPFTERFVWFKARWSESIKTDARYVDGARIHQKYLYLKVRPVRQVHLIASIVHNLMWGGRHPELDRLHGTFKDWFRDVLAQPDREVFDNVTPLGNGLGAFEFGVEHHGRNWMVGTHRMFYIEDGQSLKLPNPWDDMWRLYLDRILLKNITLAHHLGVWLSGQFDELPASGYVFAQYRNM